MHDTEQPQHYLLVLKNPLYSEIFGIAYTKAAPSEEDAQLHDPASPLTQPMRTSLHFDGIEGFGEWPILLSARAQKDLQNIKRDDGAMFQIIMKKIE